MRLLRVFIAIVLVVVGGRTAGAQFNTGEIGGIVTDSSGAVVPGATVTATHPASGIVVERVTDAEGRFYLPALRIGVWDIEVRLAGFGVQTRPGIVLAVGRVLNLEIPLSVEGVAEQVVVQARAPQLQTTNAEISDVIENREVVQLPLNGRSFLALAQLSDAVVLPPGGTRGEALQQAGPLPNVGGQRSGHNIYLLDGTKVTDELFNNLVINPSIDSIEEFKIQKSMYPAEFGGKASALINVVTRAGSNAYRGSVFEFHRNEAFDSPNYFQPAGQSVAPAESEPVWRHARRPARAQPVVLLRQLRGIADAAVVDADLLRADRCGAQWQLRGSGDGLRSADHSDDRRVHAVSEQPDPARPDRSHRGRHAAERPAAELEHQPADPDVSRRAGIGTSTNSVFGWTIN